MASLGKQTVRVEVYRNGTLHRSFDKRIVVYQKADGALEVSGHKGVQRRDDGSFYQRIECRSVPLA